MSDFIPTAEHIAEARACWLAFAEFPTYIREEKAVQCIARALAAAEARGFERGRKEGGTVVAAVRALYALPEFPHGEWSCGECGNVYPRDIIAGCPTCSPAARAALYAKEPR